MTCAPRRWRSGEALEGEPARNRGPQRWGFDHRGQVAVFEVGAEPARAVGGVTQDFGPGRFVGDQAGSGSASPALWEIATHLDEILNEMLSAGAEIATRHYNQQGAVPAA